MDYTLEISNGIPNTIPTQSDTTKRIKREEREDDIHYERHTEWNED